MGEPGPVSVSIGRSYAPVVDAQGTSYPGCILESDGKILGYTSYDYLCRLKPQEKPSVILNPGCCDTGPDSGDLPCVVRVKNAIGIKVAHGNGISVVPAEKDARALDDIVAVLGGDYRFSYYGAATKFITYLNDPDYAEAARKKKPALVQILQKSTQSAQSGMTAYVLLEMGGNTEQEEADYILKVLKDEPVFKEIANAALHRAPAHPQQAEKLVPALVYYLNRKYYDDNQVPEIFNALEKFSPVLKPFLKDLLPFEYEWSDRGAYYDFKNRQAYWDRMNKLVCSVSKEDVRTLARDYSGHGHPVKLFTCE